MASFDAVIIGGGNLGLWTAYHLARQGMRRVVVLERDRLGAGATSRSAGVVRRQGGSQTAIRLGALSRELYLRLGAELGLDSGFTETGYYLLAATPAERESFQALVALRQRLGVANEWLDAAEGRRRFPALRWERFLGATFCAEDGFVQPPIVVRNIILGAQRGGAELREMCPVTAIDAASSHFRLRTPLGTFETERVIDAAGPRGARAVAALLGIDVPVAAARHQIITFPSATLGTPGQFPMYFALGSGYYVRPEEQGALLGMSNPAEAADESGRYQLAYDWAYHEALRPVWEIDFPALAGQAISRAWAASIDFTPDHLPIIDQPRPGFYVLAAGGHGMMWGPALGMKMAELVTQGSVADLPADEIRLARFGEGRVARDLISLPFPTEAAATFRSRLS